MNIGLTIKPELLVFTRDQIHALLPYFWLIAGGVIATLGCTVKWFKPKWFVVLTCLGALILSAGAALNLLPNEGMALFGGMMMSDFYSNFFYLIFISCAIFTILISMKYLDREELQHPEYYLLILFSTFGMMLMAASLDLIIIFIALEMMSLCVYTLVGFRRSDRKSNEAAIKYFILGGAASAIFLYGVALLYGVTASTNLREILGYTQSFEGKISNLHILGIICVLLGLLFKVAAVPFHMWMPDVYEGAPTPVTGFMTTAVKAAAFAMFIRVFVNLGLGKSLEPEIASNFHDLFWVLAVITMIVGNLIALSQVQVKRMLAYSSIAHTGYLLMGFVAVGKSDLGFTPVVVYLVTYSLMNMGAFGILSIIAKRSDSGLMVTDLAGAAKKNPWLSFAMAICIFSLAGIPPTGGFIGKYMIFSAAIQAGEIWLAVIGVLCSAVSVYFYLRILVFMYMKDPLDEKASQRFSLWASVTVAAMVFMILQIGLMPSQLIEATRKAIASII